MLRTIEAVIDKQGAVHLLEPVHLPAERRALVTILDEKPPPNLRPFGLDAGKFTVPEDFDAPLPEDILKAFEGK